MNQYEKEARVFGCYLVREKISDELIALYIKASMQYNFSSTNKDQRIITYILKSPALLKFIDAALGFSGKDSLLRKKLQLFFAIAETQQAFADKFIISTKTKVGLFKVIITGIAALFKIIIGNILLLFI